jgi:hypothetical protein
VSAGGGDRGELSKVSPEFRKMDNVDATPSFFSSRNKGWAAFCLPGNGKQMAQIFGEIEGLGLNF